MDDSRRIGSFRLRHMIGQGTAGVVYLAEEEDTGQKVALKVLPGSAAANGEYTRRFLNEARLAQQVDHPNVVRVRDFGQDNGRYYLAMEHVEGESCKAKLMREGRLDPYEAVQITLQVAEGLAAALQQGIIHRDIKPENILIDKDGRVRIADLGLAKKQGVIEPQPGDTSLGTPDYMSPEQVNNSESVDFRSDIYSLGATLFHLVSGKAPYTGGSAYEVMVKHVNSSVPSIHAHVPDLPQGFCDVMREMMAQHPDDRYQSYEELIGDLRALLAGGPVTAQRFDKESLLRKNGNGGRTEGGANLRRYLAIALAALSLICLLFLLLRDR